MCCVLLLLQQHHRGLRATLMAALAAVRVPSEGGYVRAGGKPVLSPTPLVAGVGGKPQRLPVTTLPVAAAGNTANVRPVTPLDAAVGSATPLSATPRGAAAGGGRTPSGKPLVAGVGGESQRLPTTNTRLPGAAGYTGATVCPATPLDAAAALGAAPGGGDTPSGKPPNAVTGGGVSAGSGFVTGAQDMAGDRQLSTTAIPALSSTLPADVDTMMVMPRQHPLGTIPSGSADMPASYVGTPQRNAIKSVGENTTTVDSDAPHVLAEHRSPDSGAMDNSSEQPHGAQSSHDEAHKHALNDEDSNTMEAGDAGRERQSSYREEIRLKWAELPRDELTPLWEQALDADADAGADADADRNPVIWFPYLKQNKHKHKRQWAR